MTWPPRSIYLLVPIIPAKAPRCFPSVAEYAAQLAATCDDQATPAHHAAGHLVAQWISQRLKQGCPAEIIIVCTGNSRRSILGSSMGNMAATSLGLPVRFFSGGTDPSAFNPRTIAALQAIGFQVTPTGDNAPSGSHSELNPVYKIAWGKDPEGLDHRVFQTLR